MNHRERMALRRSIITSISNMVASLKVSEFNLDEDQWDDEECSWNGPEVMEECLYVYDALMPTLTEMLSLTRRNRHA